jgi:DNA-binding CsgD family transcriptional regulator
MGGRVTSPSRHSKVLIGLIEALGSALDLSVVLDRAYPLLTKLVPADYGALGVSSSGRPSDYEWMVMKIPPAFFAAYRDMAPHDFVRAKVAERPNVVLRDDQMISRSELERNIMYRRAREVGSPIEHVMAVMLHIDQRWQSGLSLYRDRRCPFSVRESNALQRVTPAIVNAVRNCRLFASAADWGKALEAAIGPSGAAAILVALPATIVEQTERAARLLGTWFHRHEQRNGRLPDALAAFVKRCTKHPFESHGPMTWPLKGGAALQVSFALLPDGAGKALGLLILQESSTPNSLPARWQAVLTPREKEVVLAVLRGWDNRLIATELGCREATVKKHLQNVFDKLAVETRTALVARALQLNCSPTQSPS